MKRSPVLCAFFAVLVGLALATDSASATSPCGSIDRARICTSHGGFWSAPPQTPPPALCEESLGTSTITCPCGSCYYPTFLDCQHLNGTWHPAASPPPPFAFCIVPGHGLQTTWPGESGGGGASGSGGVDCYEYGLVPNESGGCRRPTVCDYDPTLEGCGKSAFRSLLFDAGSLPDGLYELRRVADGSQANQLEPAKNGLPATPTILIDNTPPTVLLQADPSQLSYVSARASDKLSDLKSAAYRVDEGTWVQIQPQDGVMDSREESFRIILPKLEASEHLLILRVEDGADNVGIGRLVIRGVPRAH